VACRRCSSAGGALRKVKKFGGGRRGGWRSTGQVALFSAWFRPRPSNPESSLTPLPYRY